MADVLNKKQKTRVSKALSYALRHGVIKLGLTMDDEGYVKLDELLKHPGISALKGMSYTQIEYVVDTNEKQRFTLKTEQQTVFIRANQGHSKEVGQKIDDEQHLTKIVTPYEVCVHGTNKKALSAIMRDGLSPMRRKHVHFAKGTNDNSEVISGMRQNSSVKIYIDMARAMEDGIEFYESDNGVILCSQTVGPEYFSEIKK
jgi:2'-phosphotransferase